MAVRDYIKEGRKEGDTFLDGGKMVILQPDGTVRDASTPATDPTVTKEKVAPSEVAGVFNTEAGKKFAAGRPTYVSPTGNPSDTGTNNPEYNATIKYNADGTRKLTSDEQEVADYYASLKHKSAADIASEEAKIRQDRMIQQQQAIASINSMYDNILSQINTDNASRLGSGASINALSGNRGSASGLANESNIRTANQKVVQASENERNLLIQRILSEGQQKIKDDIFEAKKLREADAAKYIEYKAGEVDRAKARASDLRAKFIASRIKPEEISEKAYQQLADAGGYTLEEAKILYKSDYDKAVRDFTEAEEKKILEGKKTAAEIAKLEADANAKSDENILINKGYVQVSDPNQLKSFRDSGRIITEKNGKLFVAPTSVKTKVITRGSNNILIDTQTGEDIKDLGPSRTPAGSGSSKNYTATTIPADLKKDLLYDKQVNGADLDTLLNAYPEVSTSYIQSLFANPARIQY